MPQSLRPETRLNPERAPDAPDHAGSAGASGRLVEELRVHQVELALQAEALDASQHHAEREALRHRHLLAAVPVAVCRVNARGQMTEANLAMSALMGRTSAQLDGQLLFRQGCTEAARSQLLAALQSAMRHDHATLPGHWLKGAQGPVLVDLHLSRTPGAVSVEDEWLVALLDQTRQHREREALRRTHDELRAAHELNDELALVADRYPGAVMICDARLRIRWVNPGFTLQTGYTLTEARNQHPVILLAQGEHAMSLMDLVRQGLEDGLPVDRLITTLRRRDGTQFPAEMTVVPIHDASGQVTRHLVLEQDITERVESARKREALLEMQASHLVKVEFLSRMSHNMRTPLNAVLGFSQLLMQAEPPVASAHEDKLRIIHQAGRHLLGLVDQALQLARLEHVAERCEVQRLGLAGALNDCVQMLRERAQERQITVTCDVAEDVPDALAEPQRMHEILQNLLSNAIKYSDPGRTVTLRAQASDGGQEVRIDVVDQGRGIAEVDRDKLFQPFVRLAATQDMAGGHGIGLAISRRLAELMQGRIDLDSTLGMGSTFSLTLPAAAGSAASSMAPPAASPAPAVRAPLPTMSLLCVEDNPLNQLLIESLFVDSPQVSLRMADSLAQARQALQQAPVDAILLDLNLPDGNGLALAREVLRQPGPHPKVIALSADAMPDTVDAARQAGVVDYLVKPIDFGQLWGVLSVRH